VAKERSFLQQRAENVRGEMKSLAQSWKHFNAHAMNALSLSIGLLHGIPVSSDIVTAADWDAAAIAATTGKRPIHKAMNAARTARTVSMLEVCSYCRLAVNGRFGQLPKDVRPPVPESMSTPQARRQADAILPATAEPRWQRPATPARP
jgi:hypothetical protein